MDNPPPPSNQGGLPNVIVNSLTAFLALIVLLAFASMFGYGIYQTWTAKLNTPTQNSDPFLYIATSLSALIGGIVAVGFGQTSPPDSVPEVKAEPKVSSPGSSKGSLSLDLTVLLSNNIVGLGEFLFAPGRSINISAKVLMASSYAIIYFV